MSAAKAEVMESATIAESSPEKHSFGARVAAHCKKWWWVHLIIFIIGLLIVVLPVVYVAYPKIAQHGITDSTLNITSMVISDPTPDSFSLKQTQVIGSGSSYHPKIYAFDAAVSLLGAATPFTTVHIPTVQSEDGAELDVSQKVDLSDSSGFGDFATAVMMNEEVSLNIYGRPKLREGSLPQITVTYNKTVTMKGLNKLKGFGLTSFHILTEPVNGRNMNGTVYIPNPSVMTIPMGNVTLDLSIDGRSMGQAYIDNLTLKPGNNTVQMTSAVNESAVINLLLFDSAYQNGIIPLVIRGNSSVYNGQELPYFTEALSANNFTVDVNISEILSGIGIHL
ncbi:uncharacterized protein N7459_004427 [Penicillium hispanicum]|uniref:uncharacterized protein n=1 Tax=Penicillium hispanicum TaxID=1080232 RepID=UPI002540401E|nr:uncharacterized protein N7459_004427 [Penicillium hispanicum]KAJ5584627.1 hypothetical protein N7459_004427 [Penicillium hispanicum]